MHTHLEYLIPLTPIVDMLLQLLLIHWKLLLIWPIFFWYLVENLQLEELQAQGKRCLSFMLMAINMSMIKARYTKHFSHLPSTGSTLFWFTYNPTYDRISVNAPSRLLRYVWNYVTRVEDANLGNLTENDITFTPVYDQTGDIMEKIVLNLQGRTFEFPVDSTFEDFGNFWGSISKQSVNENTLNPDNESHMAIFITGRSGHPDANSFSEFKQDNHSFFFLVTIVNAEEMNEDFFYGDGVRLFTVAYAMGTGAMAITPYFDNSG